MIDEVICDKNCEFVRCVIDDKGLMLLVDNGCFETQVAYLTKEEAKTLRNIIDLYLEKKR